MEIEKERGENSGGEREVYDQEKWVYDSSLDHKGRTPLRASTGSWRGAAVVLVIEFAERLTYFGLSMNLINYLTGVLDQDLKTAAKMSNYWGGVTAITPLIGGFLADAYIGRFTMIMAATLIYLMALSLLTMSEFVPTIKPCRAHTCHHRHQKKIHEVVFFLALYMLSLATGGHKPCLESFGADQFDSDHDKERKQKMSFFNWWNFGLCSGLFLGATVIVYVQEKLGWGVADIILTFTMGASILIFYLGKKFFRYRVPEGSPLTPMLQVLVAAFRKRNLPNPTDPRLLNEVPGNLKSGARLLHHTNNLKFLDKAAVIEEGKDDLAEGRHNPWRLSTVTKVEETKLLINMVPIWLTTLVFGLCMAQTSTFFIKQGSSLDRKIGKKFEIPAAAVFTLSSIGMLFFLTLYEKILVPILRRATGNERGISILQRVGVGMTFMVLAMATAALVEIKRLALAKKEALLGRDVNSLPMSVWWLAPQYIIIAIADTFSLVGLQEYFYDQVPDSMRSLGMAFFLSVIGVGNFLSSIFITVVDHVTKKIDGKGWIGGDLKSSRLDKYYWFLTAVCGANLVVYVFIAQRYSYKSAKRNISSAEEAKTEELCP